MTDDRAALLARFVEIRRDAFEKAAETRRRGEDRVQAMLAELRNGYRRAETINDDRPDNRSEFLAPTTSPRT